MTIRLVNDSTLVTDGEANVIAAACTIQLHQHVARAWGIANPQTVTTRNVRGAYNLLLLDGLDEADALGYHDVDENGVPYIKIGCSATIGAGEQVSTVVSHECCELQCDIWCASWSYSAAHSFLLATEVCDPVQDRSYTIRSPAASGHLVRVSDFVTPAYFTDTPASDQLSWMRSLTQPFSFTHGGYVIRMQAGKVDNVFGAKFPDWKRATKAQPGSRTFWRHVNMALTLGGPA